MSNQSPIATPSPAALDAARGPLHRWKPRASARVQLVLAALMWTTAGLILGIRGIGWLMGTPLALPLFTVALILGELKARYLLDGVAKKAVDRILERGRGACAGGFLSWQSWALVLSMMAGGHALRLTAIPRPWLGALYSTIATGLLLASRTYWRGAKATFAPIATPATVGTDAGADIDPGADVDEGA